MNPLGLGRNAVLRRFELNITLTGLTLAHEWIYRTLQTITSPEFNEFVVCVLGAKSPRGWMDHGGWNTVDALLDVLAERNPDFRVVFVVARPGDWMSMPSYMPLIRSRGSIKFSSPRVENRFMVRVT